MKGGSVPPYGPAIQQAIAKGDLAEMKRLVKVAEQFVSDHGDVASSLDKLKREVKKLESKKK